MDNQLFSQFTQFSQFSQFSQFHSNPFNPTIMKLLNEILDYILYSKIYIQESRIFNIVYSYLYSYMYPKKTIIYAILYNDTKNTSKDITESFSNYSHEYVNAENPREILWARLLNSVCEIDELFDKYHLDIKYGTEFTDNISHNKTYKIIYYNNSESFIFPPYTEEEIAAYNNKRDYKKNVLFAEITTPNSNIILLDPNGHESDNDELQITHDVSDIIQQYSGPLEDFYITVSRSNPIIIHVHNIKHDSGEQIMKHPNHILRITTSDAEEIDLKKNDILKI